MTLYETLKKLRDDMSDKLDGTLPKPFGDKGYTIGYLGMDGRKVGIYPATPQGYVIDGDEQQMTAYVAIDMDCGHVPLTVTIQYLDALVSYLKRHDSDMTVEKVFCDTNLGQKQDQSLVSVLVTCRLDYHTDSFLMDGSPKFL